MLHRTKHNKSKCPDSSRASEWEIGMEYGLGATARVAELAKAVETGDGSFACSGDMLLQALVACAGVTLMSVATNRGIPVSGRVRAEGDLDFRGTMGVDREAAVGFKAIRLTFDLDSTASAEDLAAVVAATERYCVVYQTLAQPAQLSMSIASA